MAKKKKSSGPETVVVTTTREIHKAPKKPAIDYRSLINQFIRGEIDFDDRLSQLIYRISVQRIKPGGERVTIKGRTFEDLSTIGDNLGELYGTSRWKLFIHAETTDGEKIFTTIDNFSIEWDGEEEPALGDQQDDIGLQPGRSHFRCSVEKYAHEIQMKQMELQTQREIEILKTTSKGGMSPACGSRYLTKE